MKKLMYSWHISPFLFSPSPFITGKLRNNERIFKPGLSAQSDIFYVRLWRENPRMMNAILSLSLWEI